MRTRASGCCSAFGGVPASVMPWLMWCPAIGQSLPMKSGSSLAMLLKTGLPIFIAILCVGAFTPEVPAWPEQRSTVLSLTSTVWPMSLNISSVLRPMFCTRPWQGMW